MTNDEAFALADQVLADQEAFIRAMRGPEIFDQVFSSPLAKAQRVLVVEALAKVMLDPEYGCTGAGIQKIKMGDGEGVILTLTDKNGVRHTSPFPPVRIT